MSSTAAKSPKRRAKSQRKKTGPTVSDLILRAVSTSSVRGGMSLAALKKALKAGGYDVASNNARVLISIRRLVANKMLVQTKGTGASGSFKVNKKSLAPLNKKAVRKKKPKAKRVVRAVKAAGGDAPAGKKSPKKKRMSPKKAKKPAAAKRPKSPGKVKKKRVVRSTRTRAAAKK